MSIEEQIVRLERIAPNIPPCRCCGRDLSIIEQLMHGTEATQHGLSIASVAIHTRCIPKHWNLHAKGKNTGRCSEFAPTNNTLRGEQ